MSDASIETTWERWASSLRDIKARMLPIAIKLAQGESNLRTSLRSHYGERGLQAVAQSCLIKMKKQL